MTSYQSNGSKLDLAASSIQDCGPVEYLDEDEHKLTLIYTL